MNWITEYVKHHTLAETSSVLGLAVTTLCLLITVVMLALTKRSADAARAAATAAQIGMLKNQAIARCSEAIAIVTEIRHLVQAEYWHILPDRYSTLERSLVSLREMEP